MKTLYLHIGLPKTGTTSIQKFCMDNKKKLNDMGINYLINVGPDHLGRIPGPSLDILKKVAEMDK